MLYNLSTIQIQERIISRKVNIGFIGLGRVGLPLAAMLAEQGFTVTGVDIKADVVTKINASITPYEDEPGWQG